MTTHGNDALEFPGVWACRYWYPNTKHDNREDVSEYRVRIVRHGNGYVLQSLPIEALPGIWRSRCWYPNTKHDNREDTSEHYIRIDRAADGFVIHSLPDKSGSYLQAHFVTDTNLATGTYIEDTSPSGDWVGMT